MYNLFGNDKSRTGINIMRKTLNGARKTILSEHIRKIILLEIATGENTVVKL